MTARQIADLIASHAAAPRAVRPAVVRQPRRRGAGRVLQARAPPAPPGDPVAWLFKVVRTTAIDRGRADRRRVQREAASAKPERWFAESEIEGLDAEAAVAALEALPAELREVIVARLWGGMTLEQVASVAGCSLTTAHRRFEAGIAALRERLGVTCPK